MTKTVENRIPILTLSLISNLYDKNLVPIMVKKPMIKDNTLVEYSADWGVELNRINGTSIHEKNGPQ